MKPRSPLGTAGVVALVVLAAGLAFYGLRPGEAEVVVDQGPPVVPPQSGAAVVAYLRETGGFSLFGIRFADSTHHVEVQFLTEGDCSALISGDDPWPTPYPQCTGPVEMVGTVGGLGLDISGRSLVGVEMEVPRACYERLEPGMGWPPDLPQCRTG